MNENIDELVNEEEEQSFYEDESDQQPPPDIVAYNELRSCADLYRMYDKEILDITPDFQRESVWKAASQTRFIDSLIKQLPIPSMCFSLDYKTQKWQVIDGLQRMSAIIRFMRDKDWRLSNLDDIDKKLAGKKVSILKDEESPDHVLYQRLENLTLPVTVLRCDHSKKSHMEYLFTIFHRLNTGGMRLNNQEIRNCIFSGSFNSLLKDLNENKFWRTINRLGDKDDQRFKHVEIILRFFAFRDDLEKYKGVLSKFLNEYMRKNREPSQKFLNEKQILFEKATELVATRILEEDERIGTSTLEALMAGVSSNIDQLEALEKDGLRELFNQLKDDPSLASDYLSGGVAKKDKVDARIKAAKKDIRLAFLAMIARTYIESNLKQLDRLYNTASTQKKELYYSKLAMLELCGWIEESMDDVVQKCANRVLKKRSNKTFITNKVINPTYGFEYERHFKKMLINVVGLMSVEKIDEKVDQLKYARLTSALGSLKAARNREAHTHLKGVTRTVDAPSITLQYFTHVYEGLKEIDNALKALKL